MSLEIVPDRRYHWQFRFMGTTDADGNAELAGETWCREPLGKWRPGYRLEFECWRDRRPLSGSTPPISWEHDPLHRDGGLIQVGTIVLRPRELREYVTGRAIDLLGVPANAALPTLHDEIACVTEGLVEHSGEFSLACDESADELTLRFAYLGKVVHEQRVRRGTKNLQVTLPIDQRTAGFEVPVLTGGIVELADLDCREEILGSTRYLWDPERSESVLRWSGVVEGQYRVTVGLHGHELASTEWLNVTPGARVVSAPLDLLPLLRSVRVRVLSRDGNPILGAQVHDPASGRRIAKTDGAGVASFISGGVKHEAWVLALDHSARLVELQPDGTVFLERAPITRIRVPSIEHGVGGRIDACLTFASPPRPGDEPATEGLEFELSLKVGQVNELGLPFQQSCDIHLHECRRGAESAGVWSSYIEGTRDGDRLKIEWPEDLLAEAFEELSRR
ncbi:MAG: hypothetical protein HUU28_01635 [Planctomycetaceae bacterium]|nr:hypothetical protein [Planctomycetaceae bacterium]